MPDLIEAFKADDLIKAEIKITMVDRKGKDEISEDMKGVFRDALALFWEEFYLKCTVGVREKVPSIRHDFQSLDWTAVARILVKGYLAVGYFHLMLIHSFLVSILNGESDVKNDALEPPFCKFLSWNEEEVVKDALVPTTEDLSENDELMDFLGRYDCRKLPSKKNTDIRICSQRANPKAKVHCGKLASNSGRRTFGENKTWHSGRIN